MTEQNTCARTITALARTCIRFCPAAAATLLCLLVVACHNGGSSVASSAPSSAPSSSSTVSLTTINATTLAGQNYYQTLPHANLASDLTALATYLTSSQTGATAAVTPGGVAVTYTDGTTLMFFADRLDNTGAPSKCADGQRNQQSPNSYRK